MSSSDRLLEADSVRPRVTNTAIHRQDDRPVILSLLKDLPNIVTLLGLTGGLLGIYFALVGNFPAAVIAMLWAVLFDWYDGTIARRISGRSEIAKSVGGKMDSLVDIISLAVCPAVILLSYGGFSPWFFPGALVIVLAGVVRLAYFDVYGVDKDGTIAGLSLDITPLAVGLVFLFETLLNGTAFTALLYSTIVVLAAMHVASFRMRKMVGHWYHIITAYVLVLTIIYAIILATG